MIPQTFKAYITPMVAVLLIAGLIRYDAVDVAQCGSLPSVAVIILAVALGVWLGGLLGKVFT